MKQISQKRLLSITISLFFAGNSGYFIYQFVQKNKIEAATASIRNALEKQQLQIAMFSSARISKQYPTLSFANCKCMVDELTKR
ncbi:MAG: hypothetical protein ACRCYO_10760, partial [Bacteroidia bacterium]